MLQPKARWVIQETNEQKIEHLINELQIAPLVAKLLVKRGIDTVEKGKEFLFSMKDFYDPFLLNDMDVCVERIHQAIRNNEKIMVYGDYDADGTTSTYILLSVLRQLGATCDYYIPNRFTEGYGPHEAAFRQIKNEGYDLLITVDNGISGLHEAQVAKEIGLDVIITDHHEPGPELPEAVAVIHPKRADSRYPFPELAGCGVAFKVATALLGETPEELLPFVAIGTIADLVPLQDENRILVKKGLSLLKTTNHIGLQTLLEVVGVKKENVNEETIGFGIGPRINAPGRLQHAGIVVDLFLATDKAEAAELAQEINEYNVNRQAIVDEITKEAIEEFRQSERMNDHVIVVGKPGWHAGVIGIVASRIVEKFHRPTIVLSYDLDTGLAKGSARSIPNFNMYENLAECKDILPHFGGHPMAAGMTLTIENVDELRKRLNDLAQNQLTEEDFVPITEIDTVVTLEDCSIQAIEQMELLSPFGVSNPKPKILIEDVKLSSLRPVGADRKHLKFVFEKDASQLDGIGFNLGELVDDISPLASVSAIGELGINEWNNIRKPQIFIKDIAVHEWQLFDYRGQRKLTQWINKLPDERKFIVFHEETVERTGLAPFMEDVQFVFSEAEARELNVDFSNLVFVDMPPTEQMIKSLLEDKKIARIYAHFIQQEPVYFNLIPNRDQFKWYYAFLYKKGVFDLNRYGKDLAKYRGVPYETIDFMTRVFFDLEFVTINNGIVTINKQPQKRELTESVTYKQMEQQMKLEKNLLFSSSVQLKQWFDRMMNLNHAKEENVWI